MMQYVIGVDVGGTQLRAALIGVGGVIRAHARSRTFIEEGPEAVIAPARTIAYERVIVDLYRDMPILPASLGEPAGVLGAAALMLAAAEGC